MNIERDLMSAINDIDMVIIKVCREIGTRLPEQLRKEVVCRLMTDDIDGAAAIVCSHLIADLKANPRTAD